MNAQTEKLDSLVNRYPQVFGDGLPQFGFQVGSGWADLIQSLCSHIDAILKKDQLAKMSVVQVKEKFGSLRFYYQISNASNVTEKEIMALVSQAEEASNFICETCSLPATNQIESYWSATLCDMCRKLHKL